MANSIQKLNEDWCREYISEYVFKLRPEEYQNQHPIWPGSVGLEVEMLPVIAQSDGLPPKLVPLQGHSNTLASCLKRLSLKNNWHFHEQPGPKGDGDLLIKVAMERGDALTFEPGGQLEFSSVPYPCLGDAVKRLHTVQDELKKSLGECGISLLQIGQNPFYGVDEVGLQMPKERYQAMDQYFSNIGPWGQRMMRLTCTLQVCLDFGPHETIMAQRYILGQLLAPFATAIFANSPFFQEI
ncbi:MAG: glutamate-cysteine ligase family protein [Bdellovibrionota bacterium]